MDYFWDACYAVGLTSTPSLSSVPVFPEDYQRDLYQHYEVSPEIIGQGSFGYVRRVKLIPNPKNNSGNNSGNDNDNSGNNNSDNNSDSGNERKDSPPGNVARARYYACKTIPKSNLHNRELFLREVYNLNRCQATSVATTANNNNNNNCVIKLLDVVEDRTSVHIVLEMCEGGELYDYIVREHGRTGRGLRGKALSPSSSHSDNGDGEKDDDDELRCATIIFQVLTAFETIHEDARVCHRDLKASNFVFVQRPSFLPNSLNLRVIDFGLSKYVGKEEEEEEHIGNPDRYLDEGDNGEGCSTALALAMDDISKSSRGAQNEGDSSLYSNHCHYMTSEVGAPYYVAPEVLMQRKEHQVVEDSSANTNAVSSNDNHNSDNTVGYTTKCDIWSIGVLTYLTLTGVLPIMGKDEAETVEMIMDPEMEVDFSDDTLWEPGVPMDGGKKDKKKISFAAQTFCRALLQRNPEKRPTAREALRFEWIVKHCGDGGSTPAGKIQPQPSTNSAIRTEQRRGRICRLPSLSSPR